MATHHFLAIPKNHRESAKVLQRSDLDLAQELHREGKAVLMEHLSADEVESFDEDEMRLGYHIPPFNSVDHLHCHILYPISSMSWKSRLIFPIKSWIWWWSDDYLISLLETME
eukprot:TRINITY_DN1526_c0_g2_i1.p1 TRINITY_DN1526_c0_g2~~TRINITY_DN1526_c0_g2_i1.p1  ORF type:complete len:113 (+),score=20.91 TRINITY_DN1526_c0_g2_i1:98-436(+)